MMKIFLSRVSIVVAEAQLADTIDFWGLDALSYWLYC
jgi:hypothetical protein